jgi:hypothetical protein
MRVKLFRSRETIPEKDGSSGDDKKIKKNLHVFSHQEKTPLTS